MPHPENQPTYSVTTYTHLLTVDHRLAAIQSHCSVEVETAFISLLTFAQYLTHDIEGGFGFGIKRVLQSIPPPKYMGSALQNEEVVDVYL